MDQCGVLPSMSVVLLEFRAEAGEPVPAARVAREPPTIRSPSVSRSATLTFDASFLYAASRRVRSSWYACTLCSSRSSASS
jgi:hypothetical protein